MDSADIVIKRLYLLQVTYIKLKVDQSTVCNIAGSKWSEFCRLLGILVYNRKPVFVCNILRTKCFDLHFQTFNVCPREDKLILVFLPHKLINFHVSFLQVPAFQRPSNYDFLVITENEVKDIVFPRL